VRSVERAEMARHFIGVVTELAVWLAIAVVAGLIVFVPAHVMLWDKFPIWYHLSFLLSLVPLTYLGNSIASPVISMP
jgi:hypothetical protein